VHRNCCKFNPGAFSAAQKECIEWRELYHVHLSARVFVPDERQLQLDKKFVYSAILSRRLSYELVEKINK